jgi:hypothetical protein
LALQVSTQWQEIQEKLHPVGRQEENPEQQTVPSGQDFLKKNRVLDLNCLNS